MAKIIRAQQLWVLQHVLTKNTTPAIASKEATYTLSPKKHATPRLTGPSPLSPVLAVPVRSGAVSSAQSTLQD